MHPQFLCDAVQFVHLEPLATPCVSKRFECHVQADLVSESEAVSYGPGEAIYVNDVTLDSLFFDP